MKENGFAAAYRSLVIKISDFVKKKPLIGTFLTAARYFSEYDMSVYAVNAAFFFEIAAFPLIILLLSVVRFFPMLDPEQLRSYLMTIFPSVPEISSTVAKIATDLEQESNTVVSLASAVTTLISASGGVVAIIKGLVRLNDIENPTWMKYRIIAVLYTLALLILIILSYGTQLTAKLVFSLLNSQLEMPALQELSDRIFRFLKYFQIVTLLATFLIALALYCFPLGKKIRVKDQIPGAIFATAGSFLAAKGFELLIGTFWKPSSIYGSLTAIILIAYWGYIIMEIFFAGAAFNKALLSKQKIDLEKMLM